jgi:hypothetical protein
MGQGEGSIPSMGGAGGFGNQGSTGFGGGGWSDFSPTLGGGLGGGGATTPNNPPPVNQPPTMNTPTGGMPPRGGPPAGFGATGVRYPSAESDASRRKTYQSNTGGIDMGYGGGMPGSPQTPPIMHPNQPSSTGGGGGQTVPRWGTTVRPTYHYGGNTNTYNMTQQGDQINQGQNLQRRPNKQRVRTAKAPQQKDFIGNTVQQNLNAMSGGMRYM